MFRKGSNASSKRYRKSCPIIHDPMERGSLRYLLGVFLGGPCHRPQDFLWWMGLAHVVKSFGRFWCVYCVSFEYILGWAMASTTPSLWEDGTVSRFATIVGSCLCLVGDVGDTFRMSFWWAVSSTAGFRLVDGTGVGLGISFGYLRDRPWPSVKGTLARVVKSFGRFWCLEGLFWLALQYLRVETHLLLQPSALVRSYIL